MSWDPAKPQGSIPLSQLDDQSREKFDFVEAALKVLMNFAQDTGDAQDIEMVEGSARVGYGDSADKTTFETTGGSNGTALDADDVGAVFLQHDGSDENVEMFLWDGTEWRSLGAITTALALSERLTVALMAVFSQGALIEPSYALTGPEAEDWLGTGHRITDITVAAAAVVTTAQNHGRSNGDFVTIRGSNSTPTLDGSREVTVITPTTFSVPVTTTVAGDHGAVMIDAMDPIDHKGRHHVLGGDPLFNLIANVTNPMIVANDFTDTGRYGTFGASLELPIPPGAGGAIRTLEALQLDFSARPVAGTSRGIFVYGMSLNQDFSGSEFEVDLYDVTGAATLVSPATSVRTILIKNVAGWQGAVVFASYHDSLLNRAAPYDIELRVTQETGGPGSSSFFLSNKFLYFLDLGED